MYESLPAIDALIAFMNANGAHAYCNLYCSNNPGRALQRGNLASSDGLTMNQGLLSSSAGAREGPLRKALQQVRRKLATAVQPDTPPAQASSAPTADAQRPAAAAEQNGAASAAAGNSGGKPSAGDAVTGTAADPETVNGSVDASARAASNGPGPDGAAPESSVAAADSGAAEANGAAIDAPQQMPGTAVHAANGDGPAAVPDADPAGNAIAAQAVDMDVDAGEAVPAGSGRLADADGKLSTADAGVAAADQPAGVGASRTLFTSSQIMFHALFLEVWRYGIRCLHTLAVAVSTGRCSTLSHVKPHHLLNLTLTACALPQC